MDHQTVLVRMRGYLQEAFLYMRPGFVLADDDRLFDRGIIDSMGILELIDFLQLEFGVGVPTDDITEENFGTLKDIARYVVSRNGRAGPPVMS
jgi:acyl carrier protein